MQKTKFTMKEAAEYLECSVQAIQIMKKKGRIKFERIVEEGKRDKWSTTLDDLAAFKETLYNRTLTLDSEGKKVFNLDLDRFSPSMVAKRLGVKTSEVYYLIYREMINYSKHRSNYIISFKEAKEWFDKKGAKKNERVCETIISAIQANDEGEHKKEDKPMWGSDGVE